MSNLEYKKAKNAQLERQEEKIFKNECSIRSPWDSFKCTNICIMGVPEGEERNQENLFEKIMTETSLTW